MCIVCGMRTVEASSFTQLLDLLHEGTWQPTLGRHRGTWVYRGMANSGDALVTSLNRLCLGAPECPEGHLLRNFRKYAGQEAACADPSVWSWLALAQHHGLPTRLLDWTYSPLVAMHFATADPLSWEADGVIWCIDFQEAKGLLPKLYREALEREGAGVFTAELLASVAGTLADLDLHGASEAFLAFLEPPSLNERIVNQFAVLSLLSSPVMTPAEFLATHPELCRRVIIPAAVKPEVRDRLDQSNVTERVLFPGLDGLCRWLTRYYTPPSGNAAQPDGRAVSVSDGMK